MFGKLYSFLLLQHVELMLAQNTKLLEQGTTTPIKDLTVSRVMNNFTSYGLLPHARSNTTDCSHPCLKFLHTIVVSYKFYLELLKDSLRV